MIELSSTKCTEHYISRLLTSKDKLLIHSERLAGQRVIIILAGMTHHIRLVKSCIKAKNFYLAQAIVDRKINHFSNQFIQELAILHYS